MQDTPWDNTHSRPRYHLVREDTDQRRRRATVACVGGHSQIGLILRRRADRPCRRQILGVSLLPLPPSSLFLSVYLTCALPLCPGATVPLLLTPVPGSPARASRRTTFTKASPSYPKRDCRTFETARNRCLRTSCDIMHRIISSSTVSSLSLEVRISIQASNVLSFSLSLYLFPSSLRLLTLSLGIYTPPRTLYWPKRRPESLSSSIIQTRHRRLITDFVDRYE